MFISAVIILITILLIDYNTNLPSINLLVVVFITNMVLIRFKFFPIYSLLIAVVIIFVNSKFHYEHEKWMLSKFYYTEVEVMGKVSSISTHNIIIKVDTIGKYLPNLNSQKNINNHEYINYKFNKISLKAKYKNIDQTQQFNVNNIIKFKTILKPAIQLNNFINDDSLANNNYYHGIFTKTVNLQAVEVIQDNPGNYFNSSLENTRLKILSNLNEFLDSTKNSSIIKALLLGDKTQLSEQERELFKNTGTSHLIVVSGMHISFIFYLMLFIGSKLWTRYFYSKCSINKITFSFTLAFFASIFYCYISGFGIPAVRALISIFVLYLSKLLKMKIKALDAFAASLILVLLYDPLVIYNLGFWLSFIATFYLIYLFANIFEFNEGAVDNNDHYYLEKGKALIKSTIYTSSYMFLALLPLNIFYFNKIATFSIMANIIAVPIISLLVLPSLFIALLLILLNFNHIFSVLINMIISMSDHVLYLLIAFLQALSKLNINIIYLYCDSSILLIIIVLVIFLLFPYGIPKSNLILILFTLFFLTIYFKHKDLSGTLQIDILDVGQGLAVLINTKNHQLLYDTAGGISGGFTVQKVLLNTIFSNKNKLDTIVVSHWDVDHSGNLQEVLNYVTPNSLISSNTNKFNNIGASKKYHHINCNRDFYWYWDNIKFSLLPAYNDDIYRGNNSSCILKIENDKTSILLTGDIENKTEQELVQKHKHRIKSDILLVPHHGSKTSSSDKFIKQVAPKYALISVGLDNIYRLPNDSVINKYQYNNVKLYRTDLHGAIKINIKDNQIVVKTKLNTEQKD